MNATGALAAVARELRQDEKGIRRMVGPRGNPTLTYFINIRYNCTDYECTSRNY